MKIRYLEDLANVKAGEVVDQTPCTAEWLIARGFAVAVEEPAVEEPFKVYAHGAPKTAEYAEAALAEVLEETKPAPVKRGPGRPRKA